MAYTNQYDAEAPARIPGKEPPKQWPQRGVIKVEGLVLKYRPELDPVLKGLTFTVNAREKVSPCCAWSSHSISSSSMCDIATQ